MPTSLLERLEQRGLSCARRPDNQDDVRVSLEYLLRKDEWIDLAFPSELVVKALLDQVDALVDRHFAHFRHVTSLQLAKHGR